MAGKALAALTVSLILAVSSAPGAQIWRADFDSGTDGVVDIQDLNPNKVMIGGAAGGRLAIHTQDPADITGNDKAGKPLGLTLSGTDSFSAIYHFQWSEFWGDGTTLAAWDFAGFLGDDATSQSRSTVGVIMRHWRAGSLNHYWTRLSTLIADSNVTDPVTTGASISLGPDSPVGKDFQLVVSWDGPSSTLTVELFDALGDSLGSQSDVAGPTAIDNLQMKYLGWGDYRSNASVLDTGWSVDWMACYDTADEAFAAVVPEPASLLMLAGGLLAAVRRPCRCG